MSKLFTKTYKEAPKDEVSKNAALLLRAGYIHKELAGVYDFLPLGFITLQNIISIIRKHMNALGAMEMQMSALQNKSVWEQTNRWSDDMVDVWFKTQLHVGGELGLAFTHEEPITAMMKKHISSHKDLPVLVYQFQRKFRNEVRAKSGIMRTREFIMKDLYSFAASQEEHEQIYEAVSDAYIKIFDELGIGDKTYKTFASGGVFSKYSHEFQTETEVGEDIIYIDDETGIAVNEEVFTDEVLSDLGLEKDKMRKANASEVGNIFSLGTRFSDALNLNFKDSNGESKAVIMGSYGIGPARVLGVVVELMSDDDGLVLPWNIAPFNVHIISINENDKALELKLELEKQGFTVILDDRDESPGAKFKDADLIGLPVQVMVSQKAQEAGGFELKERQSKERKILTKDELISFLNEYAKN